MECDNHEDGRWPSEHRRSPKLTQAGYLHDVSILRLLESAIKRNLATRHHLRILDVGCGQKPYYPLFQKKAVEYIGVDKRDYGSPNNRLGRVDGLCDVQMLPFRRESFDLILCSQVLEHLAEPVACLAECRRILQQDGICFLFVPCFWPVHLAPNDYRRWTRYGIALDLRSVGFDIMEIDDCGGSASGIAQMLTFAIDAFRTRKRRWQVFWSFAILFLNVLGLILDKKIENVAFTTNLFVVCRPTPSRKCSSNRDIENRTKQTAQDGTL